ncbi:MAG: GDP-L-fucose synthase [Rhodospirillaceae bacterium]|jgi:GDP-L-fucose synthase|nr:GDP-L-fucose synthase [Rhodospirillaceae bacterium]MBT3809757.1 GDP-L-fucose synthase [Rhodospirillaceae bacterium]MBT3930665.1 GDP-L-fucose synthase [Rhodospirillaceae bacterium]MBT4772432.1 GDP-L-fucose synthase [Rhodospirillaceae bacterium]MBT5358974.1 GDP-L-fucose synthase [Rhodospirillaceae bacterium]
MEQDAKIYIAGHRGLVGQALVRQLNARGHTNIVTRTSQELDLTEQAAVREFFDAEKPDYVLDAAAIVGGIMANDLYPADFIAGNLKIQTNLIDTAYRAGAKKMLFLGSTCIMPHDAPQPMKEEYMLTGPLEETNQWYAVAKIAGIKMCQAYRRQYGFDAISVQPTNLFGIGDNFDYETSHMAPAMIRRMHEAKLSGADNVVIWGTGTPKREIMFVDDMADACVYLMNNYSDEPFVNIGTGEDISIADFATLVADVVGYSGSFSYDSSRPDGTPRKLVDVSRLTELGWQSKISLREGVERTYAWYLDNEESLRTLSAENLARK